MPDQIDLDDVSDIDVGDLDIEEQQEKEKTMTIRDKLSKRKQGGAPAPAKSSSSGKSRRGFMTPLLLLLLVIVGVLLLWQIKQLSDTITFAMSGEGGFDSSGGTEQSLSYDYAIDFILDPNLTDRMAARGREGWQVVGSRRTQDSTTGQYGYEFIFMRRLQGR
jgi:hypothetical protein